MLQRLRRLGIHIVGAVGENAGGGDSGDDDDDIADQLATQVPRPLTPCKPQSLSCVTSFAATICVEHVHESMPRRMVGDGKRQR